MRVIVDGDGCPAINIIEKLSKEYNIELIIYCDINHFITLNYGEVKIVDSGFQSVDMKVVNETIKGDIVVSQDYGVAAMALGKGCFAIHQSGKWYTNDNIDQMLMERHLAKKARRSSKKHHLKGPAKRTIEDDQRFEESFEKMIRKVKGLNESSCDKGEAYVN